ncbi:MAG: alpha/beta hydrolase [Acidimicrobiaceae bacterium]|nr:alpha/beta hydrolase [Acidimicrobiaceae bacterium]MXZ65344.1 alpha/beta hydrolase [Acidimicrobiaceae bacterium]MYF34436.1 alpha/beta hydrolase [Acidimicrobiaceae bacterium]MYG79723.1 alpha/beta hydrolase [Acidimicrobiaceae bacterium]MYJ83864.1 alpha/beta hydrolase [Acidimicrobiaceae bacterium]
MTSPEHAPTPMASTATSPLTRVDIGEVQLATRVLEGSSGQLLLFIHGSLDDHHTWLPLTRALAGTGHTMVVYDRRGHSASTDVAGQGTIRQDADDAARLIERLGLGRVHVVGHSYGAATAVLLAAEHPDLVASLYLHEPPAFALLTGRTELEELKAQTGAVARESVALLDAGRVEEGTAYFVEEMAFGAGSWSELFDDQARAVMMANSDTWLDQSRDPERLALDVTALNSFDGPVTFSVGSRTLPAFTAATAEMLRLVPGASGATIEGAGHGAPTSHPDELAAAVRHHLDSA